MAWLLLTFPQRLVCFLFNREIGPKSIVIPLIALPPQRIDQLIDFVNQVLNLALLVIRIRRLSERRHGVGVVARAADGAGEGRVARFPRRALGSVGNVASVALTVAALPGSRVVTPSTTAAAKGGPCGPCPLSMQRGTLREKRSGKRGQGRIALH